MSIGDDIHGLAQELFPICRSLTGNGVRETLRILQRELPGLEIHEIPTGTKCFDWTVPDEWNVRDAYVLGPDGEKVIDFGDSNLHLVGYSEPVDTEMPLSELQAHLHSLPEQPDAIPYVTSYYERTWGFCLQHERRERLPEGTYRVKVDSSLEPGHLTYAELVLEGSSPDEVFLSTYVCHPSMGNNELSGPTVTCYLAKWLAAMTDRRFTYRIVFVPETIGSITYLSRGLYTLKERIRAGFNVSCVGDDRCYSYLPSRQGDTLADRVALHALRHHAGEFKRYTYLDRGSDERQYCAPGVDLPVCCMMRSKYGEYPEYHTSLDDLAVVSPDGLGGAYQLFQRALECLEKNVTLQNTVVCEPQLGSRGLYPTTSKYGSVGDEVERMLNVLAYADGTRDLLALAEEIGEPMWELQDTVATLLEHGLVTVLDRR